MKLHQLPKLSHHPRKRLGRGLGSGKGKTGGRGQKGQTARDTIPASFIGGTLPLYKRLPLRRGWGNQLGKPKPILVKLGQLANFKTGSKIDLQTLIEQKIVDQKQAERYGVKILSDGEIKVALTVNLPVSKKAADKVVKAGGKIGNV
ncbi:50S ribosomal protein L15 [Candidatus Daviesbacteria bacterium]|nr:50S ribosomal protein L15 [Candidatus Daviesbacteria bacterium]